MTTGPLKQFMDPLQKVRLTDDERSTMRRTLLSFTHTHTPRPSVATFLARHTFGYAFAALVLLAGGTTVLANRSLPGDFLYPVKIAVNDHVAVTLAGDDDAQIAKELDIISHALDDEDTVAETESRALIEPDDQPTSIEFHDDAETDLNDIDHLLLEDDGSATIESSL